LVVKHTHALKLVGRKRGSYSSHDVQFAVNEKGRERVLKEKRKNVHAFVRGCVMDLGKVRSLEERKARKPKTLRQVTYNPYKYETFVDVKTGEAVHYAKEVFIDDRKVYITKESS
jgi:hypothetical protein